MKIRDKTQTNGDRITRICSVGGGILLALTALLLAVMPLTEHFWTFDGSLAGGEDFELTLLAVLAVSCMVLLLAQSIKEKVTDLIALREWIWLFSSPSFSGRQSPFQAGTATTSNRLIPATLPQPAQLPLLI